jgi:hypothetical protein
LRVAFPQQIPPTDKTRIQLVQFRTVQELPQLPGISPFVEVPTPKSLDPQDPFLPSSDPDEMLDLLPDFIKDSATERAFFIAFHDQWYKINKFYAFQEGFFINEVCLNKIGPEFQYLLILARFLLSSLFVFPCLHHVFDVCVPYHLQLNRIIQYVNDNCPIGPRGLPCGDTLSGNEVDILKQGLQVCCNPDKCFSLILTIS